LTFKILSGCLFTDICSEWSTGSVYWYILLFVYSWFMQPNFQLTWLCIAEWWDDKWMMNWCLSSDGVNISAYDGVEEMDRSTKTCSHGGRFVGLETSWIPVRSQASPYGTCDRQMALGQVFLRVLWFSPSVSLHQRCIIIYPPLIEAVCVFWATGSVVK
jgi:hypothetical protein